MKKIFVTYLLSVFYISTFAQVLVKPNSGVPTYEPYKPTQLTAAPKATTPPKITVKIVPTKPEPELSDTVRTIVDTPPKSKISLNQMYQQVIENMDYPTLSRRNKTKGFIPISFVVTKDGKTQDFKFEQKSSADELNNEVLKAVESFLKKNTNNWIPAIYKGKFVNAYYNIDFNFLVEKRK